MEWKTISRNPFARLETIRRRVPRGSECAFCGQVARFEYGTETDNGKRHTDGKYFCNIGCRKAYY